MPLYRYQCDQCGHTFSELEPVNAPKAPRVCQACGAKKARRVLARVGVLFKGSGFYKTNYPRQSSNSNNKKKETTSSSSEG